MQRKFTRYGDGSDNYGQKREGEVNIDSIPENPKKDPGKFDEDEYVDFEEIKKDDQE